MKKSTMIHTIITFVFWSLISLSKLTFLFFDIDSSLKKTYLTVLVSSILPNIMSLGFALLLIYIINLLDHKIQNNVITTPISVALILAIIISTFYFLTGNLQLAAGLKLLLPNISIGTTTGTFMAFFQYLGGFASSLHQMNLCLLVAHIIYKMDKVKALEINNLQQF